MTNNNLDRLAQLEALVLDFARTVNQSQVEYNQRQQEVEAKLADQIETTNENFKRVQQESQLREAQQVTNEAVRSIGEDVSEYANIFPNSLIGWKRCNPRLEDYRQRTAE